MQSNLKFFITILVLLGVLSYYVLNQNSEEEVDTQMLIPNLKEQVNDIDEMLISQNDKSLSFKKVDGVWVLEESNNYFADINKIANLLMELRNMNLKSPKTSNPEKYNILSLDESGENAAIHVVLKQNSTQVADVYLGKKATNANATYVRKASEKQTWLASGSINLDLDESNWIVKSIINIPADQILSVDFDIKDQSPYRISKLTPADTEFLLSPIPDNKQVKSISEIESLANGLVNLSIEKPQKATALELQDAIKSSIKYTLFSGISYQLKVYELDEKNYLTVDLAENQIYSDFDKQLPGWLFEIPSYKFDALTKPFNDLIEDKQEELENSNQDES
jgi:hypothetical protein